MSLLGYPALVPATFPPPSTPPGRSLAETVSKLSTLWRRTVLRSSRRLGIFVVAGATLGAAHVARIGTGGARLGAGIAIGFALLGVIVVRAWQERRLANPRRAIEIVGGAADPERAARTLRAMSLVERAGDDPSAGSRELADLHLGRQLAGFSEIALRTGAENRAKKLRVFVWLAAALTIGAALWPFRLLEGFDVLFARDRRAPVPLPYLVDLELGVHPPDYLHAKDRENRDPSFAMDAPYGSLITVHGRPLPLLAGRRIVLTDGSLEVPFVDDGSGGLTARWALTKSVSLEVAAKHGDVWIPEAEPLELRSLPDLAPVVKVDKSPRSVKLIEEPDVSVTYQAIDDHGLREVDLVMRSAGKEDRRVLSKLDGETREDSGGYAIRSNDRFVKDTFLPVEVTVEARDNDPLTGPKWGKSAIVMLVPPAIGEREALRYEALLELRDALVDMLAVEVKAPLPKTAEERRTRAIEDEAKLFEVEPRILMVLSRSFGGLGFSKRMLSFATGQGNRLRAAIDAEKKTPSEATHAKVVKATETALLGIDRAARTMANHDAQTTAKRLSRVATEAADGFQMAQGSTEEERGKTRADAAISVIEPSGKAISRLGALGEDLGGIVKNDTRRMDRAEKSHDYFHAELAARDLAARLSRPNPSFAGGGGGGQGTESGGGKGSEAGDEADSDAEGAFDEESEALEELAKEHAGNIEDVQQQMRGGMTDDEKQALLDEAKKHADAVRESVKQLPRPGEDDGSPSSAAASAREQALGFADALERGDLKEAVEAGRQSESALGHAKDAGTADPTFGGERVAKAAEDAKGKLSPEVRWAEKMLENLRQKTKENAHVGEAGQREGRMADRAKSLGEQGRGAHGAMQEETGQLLQQAENRMRDASKALEKGDGEKALEAQREAQRMLEQARAGRQENDESDDQSGKQGGKTEGGNDPGAGHIDVPKADQYKGPEEFRKRVLEGLAKGQTPGLKPAIQRYAEKLLR